MSSNFDPMMKEQSADTCPDCGGAMKNGKCTECGYMAKGKKKEADPKKSASALRMMKKKMKKGKKK